MNHWIFVTRPEYYLDENGEYYLNKGIKDRWSCGKDTKEKDRILFYCSKKMKGIQSWATAEGDSEEDKSAKGWGRWMCDIKIQEKYKHPLLLKEFSRKHKHRELEDCKAITGNFQRAAFLITEGHYDFFIKLLDEKQENKGS